ncbi:MAG: hypothetical protein WBD28_08570 [Candidatus Zixiibacteriota bacterium]
MKIDKRYILIVIPFLALLGIWIQGCLLSGTYVITYEVEEEIISTEKILNSASVDLSENDTWADHNEDIKYVDEVAFTFKVENLISTDSTTGQLYITDIDTFTNVDDIRDNATLIVDGIELGPGEMKHILWNECFQYILNLDVVKAQVESGTFHLYGICKETPFHVYFYDIVAVITVTAGI